MTTPFFTVVATIFTLVNGQPAATSADKLYNPAHFETMDQCRDWMGSEDFKTAREALGHLVERTYDPGTVFTVACEEHTRADFVPEGPEAPQK
jgi:hypothetical protein